MSFFPSQLDAQSRTCSLSAMAGQHTIRIKAKFPQRYPNKVAPNWSFLMMTSLDSQLRSKLLKVSCWQYGIKNQAAIAVQCKSYGKLIAALLFIPFLVMTSLDSQLRSKLLKVRCWQYPQIGLQYGIKNKAAIALQCKSYVKRIDALLQSCTKVVIPHNDFASQGKAGVSNFFPSDPNFNIKILRDPKQKQML